MLTMKVIGRTPIQFPYTAPTVAWQVQIRNGRKAATLTVHMGQGYASGPGSDLVPYLRELAEDRDMDPMEYEDIDTPEDGLSRKEAIALAVQGETIAQALIHLGLMEE